MLTPREERLVGEVYREVETISTSAEQLEKCLESFPEQADLAADFLSRSKRSIATQLTERRVHQIIFFDASGSYARLVPGKRGLVALMSRSEYNDPITGEAGPTHPIEFMGHVLGHELGHTFFYDFSRRPLDRNFRDSLPQERWCEAFAYLWQGHRDNKTQLAEFIERYFFGKKEIYPGAIMRAETRAKADILVESDE